MAARPAASRVISGRTWTEQRTVGLLAAELGQIPWALHCRQHLERRHHAGGDPHRQHEIAQRAAEMAPGSVDQPGEAGGQGQNTKQYDQLLGAVVQDVFQKPAVPADKPAARLVHPVRQRQVEADRLDAQQQRHQAEWKGERPPIVEWAGRQKSMCRRHGHSHGSACRIAPACSRCCHRAVNRM
ncbi:hypothetical protein D3C80_1553300 [compost metagenome]